MELNTKDRELLEALVRTRMIQASIMNRACIILLKADGESTDSIAEKIGLNCNSVLLCIKSIRKAEYPTQFTMHPAEDVWLRLLMMRKLGS